MLRCCVLEALSVFCRYQSARLQVSICTAPLEFRYQFPPLLPSDTGPYMTGKAAFDHIIITWICNDSSMNPEGFGRVVDMPRHRSRTHQPSVSS